MRNNRRVIVVESELLSKLLEYLKDFAIRHVIPVLISVGNCEDKPRFYSRAEESVHLFPYKVCSASGAGQRLPRIPVSVSGARMPKLEWYVGAKPGDTQDHD
jgi:hypothetical protein